MIGVGDEDDICSGEGGIEPSFKMDTQLVYRLPEAVAEKSYQYAFKMDGVCRVLPFSFHKFIKTNKLTTNLSPTVTRNKPQKPVVVL